MAEPARFSPEELDRIEDALEWLEDPSAPAIADPSPQVRDILEAYRDVLVASREAMPMEEVPAGVLASVFAEAEASVTGAEVAPPVEPVRPGLWTRLRKAFLVPSVALAGTAALVLLMNWATLEDDGGGVDRPEVAVNEQSAAAPNAKGEPVAPKAAAQADIPDDADAEKTEDAAPSDEASAAAAPPPAPGTVETLTKTPSAQQAVQAGRRDDKALDSLGDVPEPEPKPEPEPEVVEEKAKDGKKDAETAAPRWDLIERADRARQDSDCAAARSDYMIATEDDDPSVRARAYAGLGLCNMQMGDDAGAEDAFERARGEDSGIDKFINAENKASGSYGSKPRKKAPSKSKSSKKPVNLDQAYDPF